ncbi:MAG: septum formation initiator family protein [Tannerellaceae bacterium]|jgi:cell division protein FtsB|nr:septum formation initiator family protein [Tannerellaceae bacterium]
MEILKGFYKKYFAWINAYWLVIIAFFLLTFATGDCSLYHRFIYDRKIRRLETDIEYYRKELEANRQKLENLHTDREGLERFAREEYLMKAPNEDLFIIRKK